MQMVNWKVFHELVLPVVPGCPVAVVNSAIKSAVIEFCEKSNLWQAESEPTDIVAGIASYSFKPPTGSKVVEGIAAYLEGRPLHAVSIYDLNLNQPTWRELETPEPNRYFMDGDHSIRLVGTPAKALQEALTIQVALKPTRAAVECPSFLYEDWAETIASGALARLLVMPGKDWTHAGMAEYHKTEFKIGIARARSKAMKSRQNVPTRVRFVRFGDL